MGLALKGLSELISFYFPWNHQKIKDFVMILGGIEINHFAEICLILEVGFGDDS